MCNSFRLIRKLGFHLERLLLSKLPAVTCSVSGSVSLQHQELAKDEGLNSKGGGKLIKYLTSALRKLSHFFSGVHVGCRLFFSRAMHIFTMDLFMQFRSGVQAATEIREGPTYQTNVNAHDPEVNIQEIPAPVPHPKKTTAEYQDTLFFDLETTGRGQQVKLQ